MFTSVPSRAAAAYRRVAADTSIQGADPHQLVSLLFEALVRHILAARGALERRDAAAKGVALGKAVRIIEEGLKAGLNIQEGGEIAANLRSLYEYCVLRLTQANLRNDRQALDEVIALIEPVAESWKQIRGPGPAYLQPVAAAGA
ncbi:MAG: flagellar export chaperone FliS [Burkholderiales bacterium]|nr:MAG: flagellar export chaperone FliS [Burkholderiales bacterium]